MAKQEGFYPPVFIERKDSTQPTPNWQYQIDFNSKNVVICASIGWLIHDGEDAKVLAPNTGDTESGDSLQVSGFIRIPESCIVNIEKLKEPEITSFSPSIVPSFHLGSGQLQQET